MDKKAEILAPAGGPEALTAAVRCGADAVYLGAPGFNARRNAENFTADNLANAITYCHGRGVRVYVTVNTLVSDAERPALEATADLVATAGADAVILQDMAAARLFANRYPSLGRVASTQTAVHNVDGARFLYENGFDTIVLARELSLKEMETICSLVPVRAEAFVHGAHCMSVSGACYLSATLGGRSGNRGLCAQPCRLDWRCGQRDHALSLKDMSLISHLRDMVSAGVQSFKIEGRMKRPEYVAAAVTACRKALSGEPYDADTLRAVFSRSGFTDGYLTARRDADMFGYRTKEDVTGAESVLKKLAQLYKTEAPIVPVKLHFVATETGVTLSATDGKFSVTAAVDAPEKALHRETEVETVRRALERMGGTPFYPEETTIHLSPGLALSAAQLNSLRRESLERLLIQREHRPAPVPSEWTAAPVTPKSTAPTTLWARFSRAEQVTELPEVTKFILPLSEITEYLLEKLGPRLVAELPAVLFPEDEPSTEVLLRQRVAAGLRTVYVDNIYGIELGRRLNLKIIGGFGLNIMNSEAVRFYEEQGLSALTVSFECPMKSIATLDGTVPRGAAVYGRMPLMRLRTCPVRAAIGCAKCRGHGSLTDRKGVVFPVECTKKRYSTLLNSVPLHLADRSLSALDYGILWFTTEDKAEILTVAEEFRRGIKSPRPRTGGLYYRELL